MGKVPGCTAGPALCFTRRLCVNVSAVCVLYEIWSCGSQCGGSQSRRLRVPPRLGVCAQPAQGGGGGERPAGEAEPLTARDGRGASDPGHEGSSMVVGYRSSQAAMSRPP